MSGHSIKVPQPRLRLVSGEREPSAEPDMTLSGPPTDSPSPGMTAPWSRLRTYGAATQGASRSPDTSIDDLADMEYLALTVLARGYGALDELGEALEARDAVWVARCCRRLSSFGELARLRGGRLEGRQAG